MKINDENNDKPCRLAAWLGTECSVLICCVGVWLRNCPLSRRRQLRAIYCHICEVSRRHRSVSPPSPPSLRLTLLWFLEINQDFSMVGFWRKENMENKKLEHCCRLRLHAAMLYVCNINIVLECWSCLAHPTWSNGQLMTDVQLPDYDWVDRVQLRPW